MTKPETGPVERARQLLDTNPVQDLASKQKEWFDAYIKAGFSEEQAMRLVLKLLDLGVLINARKK
ncbi:MAG: hypothetical protein PHX83_12135 [Acidobacteriia bacterium]|nr:hypothetical protein [Terriglobia bacterium]